MTYRIEIFSCKDELPSIVEDWYDLAKKHGSHFLHFPGWYLSQIEAYPDTNFFFAYIFEKNGLIGIVPLHITNQRIGPITIKTLSLAYDNEMGVADCISRIDLKKVIPDIIKAVKRSGRSFQLVRFKNVIESGHLFSINKDSRTTLSKPSHDSKFLDISAGSEAFYTNYSKKFKRDLKRKKNLAEQTGELTVKSYTGSGDFSTAFQIFLSIEDSGWKGERGSSIKKQPKKLHYYQQLLKHYSSSENACINLLYIGEKCVAAQFGVIAGETLYLLKIAYDESFSKISPGFLLIDQLILNSDHTTDYKKISFVTGVAWADRWKPQVDQVWLIYYFSNPAIRLVAKVVYQSIQTLSQYKRKKSNR